MKFIIAIAVSIFLFPITGNSCSVICSIPNKLDKNTFIGEGRIIAYKGNYSHPDVKGEIGLLEVAITTLLYPSSKPTKLYISHFFTGNLCEQVGYSEEDLRSLFPLNEIISFVGEKMNILGDSILHIGICDCCPVLLGSMENRISYDYKNQRRLPKGYNELLEQFQEAFDGMVREDRKEVIDAQQSVKKTSTELYIPEHMQIYLDMVELTQARTRELRFYILRRLIWSSFMDLGFIGQQRISAKQKSILSKEIVYINEKWKMH